MRFSDTDCLAEIGYVDGPIDLKLDGSMTEDENSAVANTCRAIEAKTASRSTVPTGSEKRRSKNNTDSTDIGGPDDRPQVGLGTESWKKPESDVHTTGSRTADLNRPTRAADATAALEVEANRGEDVGTSTS